MGLTNEIGIMQGRLSPRIDGKIQAYPAGTWQKEFEIAQEIGYAAIEWIVEKPVETNALMTTSGKKEIKKVIPTDKKVTNWVLDPFLETADIDTKSNIFPREPEQPTRFQVFKQNRPAQPNPMQLQKQTQGGAIQGAKN